jgi:hypothetical protein
MGKLFIAFVPERQDRSRNFGSRSHVQEDGQRAQLANPMIVSYNATTSLVL